MGYSINTPRWMKSWGVSIASEKQMRLEAKELIGDNLRAELIPLTFTCKDGSEEVKETPMAYIPRLWDSLHNNLEHNDDEKRSVAR